MAIFIKWLAHASFQIKTKGKVIYIDLTTDGQASEKADLILVTHSHSDHCDPSEIKRVLKKTTDIIAPDDCVAQIGGNVRTLHVGEETTVTGIKVRAVDAYNLKRFRSPGVPFHPKKFGVGYLISINSKTIYHAGDTDFIPEMRQLGPVDVALLPSGDTYTMNNVDAARATIVINPKIVIPMHRWSTKPEDFKRRVEAMSAVEVLLLQEGDEYRIA